jgi:hypothetical protein
MLSFFLAQAIAVGKVKAVEGAIALCFALKQEVGSYALMAGSGFEQMDFLQCCKFAEGDSRILMQKMARDIVRAKRGEGAGETKALAELQVCVGTARASVCKRCMRFEYTLITFGMESCSGILLFVFSSSPPSLCLVISCRLLHPSPLCIARPYPPPLPPSPLRYPWTIPFLSFSLFSFFLLSHFFSLRFARPDRAPHRRVHASWRQGGRVGRVLAARLCACRGAHGTRRRRCQQRQWRRQRQRQAGGQAVRRGQEENIPDLKASVVIKQIACSIHSASFCRSI